MIFPVNLSVLALTLCCPIKTFEFHWVDALLSSTHFKSLWVSRNAKIYKRVTGYLFFCLPSYYLGSASFQANQNIPCCMPWKLSTLFFSLQLSMVLLSRGDLTDQMTSWSVSASAQAWSLGSRKLMNWSTDQQVKWCANSATVIKRFARELSFTYLDSMIYFCAFVLVLFSTSQIIITFFFFSRFLI